MFGGRELTQVLSKFDYRVSRQTGSHMRLTTLERGEHHVTIPAHSPIKVGTLNNILGMVALHFEITRQELVDRLFG
ncbi:MAG: type II toxin-antitoxin system HicA family toxin [Dehalococcoidia bacterium]